MPWYFPWSESIKKRACRYLLQYYLGRFLETKLELDQLSVDLYKGTGSVKNVQLDVEALNQMCEEENLPIEVWNGCISEVTVSVPWSNLLYDSCYVEIKGLELTVNPKHQSKNGFTWESMINSMSMASSMKMAEECLKQDQEEVNEGTQQNMEGLESFAKLLESVLARIKVRLLDTVVRLECVPSSSLSGLGVEIHITKIDYFDMAGLEQNGAPDQPSMIERTSYATKKFLLEGVTVYTDEFLANSGTMQSSSHQDEDPPTSDSSCEDGKSDTLILCGKLNGRHEISIHMKLSDVVAGPKVELDLVFGSSVFFLSPRQLHSLAFLVDWFTQPTKDNKKHKVRQAEKPMQPSDYRKIENELLHQFQYSNASKLRGEFLSRKSWSSGIMDVSCEEEDFHPFSDTSKHSNFHVQATAENVEKTVLQDHDALLEDTHDDATQLKFHMKVGSLVLVLLHEDILACNSRAGGTLVESTVISMKSMAERFFCQTGLIAVSGMGTKGCKEAKEKILKASSRSHFQLIMAPLNLSGVQEDCAGGLKFDYQVSAGFAELLECLTDKTSADSRAFTSYSILSFLSNEAETCANPNILIKFSSAHPNRHAQTRGFSPLKAGPALSMQLSPCNIEVDISIVDRITALLSRPAFVNSNKSNMYQMYRDNVKGVDSLLLDDNQQQTCINISSSLLNLRLRFPIPDLRPIHDPQRTPWWHRCLRPDVLTIQLCDVSITTNYVPNDTVSIYEMQCKKLSCLYRDEDVQREEIAFLHAGAQDDDDVDMEDEAGNYDFPRLVFTLRPFGDNLEEQESFQNEGNILEEELDAMNLTGGESTAGSNKSKPSPFSRQQRVHGGEARGDDGSNLEELLIPGSTEDITKFISFSSRNCSFQVDISLPKVDFALPSKEFYEKLYNRLSTDLCLWEPSAPMFMAAPQKNFFDDHQSTAYSGLSAATLHTPTTGFIMCKSGVAYDSDSESESDGNAEFHSIYGLPLEHSKSSKDTPSKLCISVMIGKASGTVICNLKEPSGEDCLSHHGELNVSLVNGKLFSVTAFKGNPSLGYVCFRASKADVYHNGAALSPPKDFSIQSFRAPAEDQIVYSSCEAAKSSGKNSAAPMLSVVVEIQIDARADVKKFKTAVAVETATLRHRFCPVEQNWLTQIVDFFDVVDFPIVGYKPPKVITELHSSFSNCGVDYRPLNLPAKVFVGVGALNISSNIVAQTKSSLLRFVVEDLSLHLSNRPGANGFPNVNHDYICVLDVDVAELSLRIQEAEKNEKRDTLPGNRQPKIDLEAMINVLHLQTCSDSCRLLLDLLTYLADDGDLDEASTAASEESSSVIKNDCDNSKRNGTCEKQVTAQVCNLMADAMIDSSPTAMQQSINKDPMVASLKCQTEVFFFPDESTAARGNQPVKQEETVSSSNGLQARIDLNLLNAALSQPSEDSDHSLEEDFCILGNDPGVGIRPRGGEPTIRQLNTVIQVRENHFSAPFGKADVLKAPKHFPRPIVRYALRDMTFIWDIYGGHDFSSLEQPSNNKKQPMKTVTFAKGQDNQVSVKFGPSSHKTEKSGLGQSNNTSSKRETKQRCKGGIGRLEDVKLELQMTKVRFIHDVYPDTAVQASREVLSIGEIEIRDRLAQSHINKLLYQYCSEARPRQSHANMVLIKALHVRPDFHGSTQECCLKISMLPLRLHLDQDTLTFIGEFFGSLSSSGAYNSGAQDVDKANIFTPVPVMNVNSEPPTSVSGSESSENVPSPDANDSSQPIYFRSFTFSPDVLIRFDYHGKGVDLSQGPSLAGLLAGLGQLNCSQLTLKRMSNRHGLLGMNRLAAYAINEWIVDIKKNQLPSVMAGVGPMHSIVQLVQGIRDLFWLPIEQYQRDGRIVRGLQRGANAFSTSAAFAILELTSRMIQTLQTAAETAYDVVSPGPSVRRSRSGSRGCRRRHTQPTDIRDGVAKAYQVVKEGLGETAQNLVRVASEEAEQKGVTGAVGGVLRQIPPIVVKPIILATEATVNVIGGVQSQLVPDTRREAIDKWRQDDL